MSLNVRNQVRNKERVMSIHRIVVGKFATLTVSNVLAEAQGHSVQQGSIYYIDECRCFLEAPDRYIKAVNREISTSCKAI